MFRVSQRPIHRFANADGKDGGFKPDRAAFRQPGPPGHRAHPDTVKSVLLQAGLKGKP
jgi:hypothetical protein